MVAADAGVDALVLRAQIHLAAERFESAAEDLRRAVFLAPQSWQARYWYVVALQASRRQGLSAQIRELTRQLEERTDEEVLVDGVTRVGELKRALATFGALYE